jgi:peptide/nickel transport system ATP-binding protein
VVDLQFLEIKDLKVHYQTLRGYVKAVDGVDLKQSRAETLGLVGESACGKTTTAFSLLRLLPPQGRIVAGEIFLEGDDILKKTSSEMREIRWKRISMIFQNAMNALNPVLRIRDQIIEPILTHEKVGKVEAVKRAEELMEMVRMDRSNLDSYPHELSGGMRQRSIIAMALANRPQLIIADEPTSALDVVVQAQILQLLKDLQAKMSLSMILITHDLSIVAETCNNIAVMYAGKIVESADAYTILRRAEHPYTKAMVEAFPSLDRPREERLTSIKGTPPELINPPSGCRFHPRCPYAKEICKIKEPEVIGVGADHTVACHLYP